MLAKILGTNINLEASLGGVFGIFIKNGKLTLDQDGDPATNANSPTPDRGATFRLGLKNNNGDGRHYFDESGFNSSSIDLRLEGGGSAQLPIYAPFEGTALSGDGDTNGDDTIQGGDDWDLILGDSGNIAATAVIGPPPATMIPGTLAGITTIGGPGKDIIHGGNGPDWINSQLFPDQVWGDSGQDQILTDRGDDVIYVDLDDDWIDAGHGTATVLSSRDVAIIELDHTGAPAQLRHKLADGQLLTTFYLTNVEVARLYGGARNNTFNLLSWSGSAYISGGSGTDRLIVENNTDQKLKDAPNTTAFANAYGFKRDASISLAVGGDYQLGSVEKVTLRGGASGNRLDASGFSRSVTLEGLAGDDTLIGGSANDTLIGGAGNDLLRGNNGDDTYVFDVDSALGEDTIDESGLPAGGTDTLDFSATTTVALSVNLSLTTQQTVHATNLKLTLLSGASMENVTGGDQADTLVGERQRQPVHRRLGRGHDLGRRWCEHDPGNARREFHARQHVTHHCHADDWRGKGFAGGHPAGHADCGCGQ